MCVCVCGGQQHWAGFINSDLHTGEWDGQWACFHRKDSRGQGEAMDVCLIVG